MKFRKPAVLTATAAVALLPLSGMVAPAQAATAPKAKVAAAAAPTQEELILLVLSCFPLNIQLDVAQILTGDYINGVTKLLNDVTKLTPAQLQEIATKLQAILGKLPIPQQTALKSQLKKGVTKQEALTILLARR
ncbi:hypothetical protein [Actinomadura macrotermitis]|uniref:Uncharacterized protein n=1 Tax=Actinomadura macrotermitis TaxID=2585200 RepID=A0A7K0BRT3_9ACTN|nr:hypothetical protein [Actinomadura macrotermitis]MQY03879.1 hypothetical protein [Actinomadura macrotermitis]